MRRSVLLLSALITLFMVALVAPLYAAESFTAVSVSGKKVELSATMGIDQVKYFTLDSPKRLVVDLYGVQPGDHSLNLPLSSGFKLLRTGPLNNKTRFVFDVSGPLFPTFNVKVESTKAVVTWEQSQEASNNAIAERMTNGSAKITEIDFTSKLGKSAVHINLAGTADVTKTVRDGNKIQFALKNTTLPRSLRREFDTLAFPSAIHSVTPYLVNSAGKPEVRFVVLLKGDVPYRLTKTSTGFSFSVDDAQYAHAGQVTTGKTAIPVNGVLSTESNVLSNQASNNINVQRSINQLPVPVIEQVGDQRNMYTGEKTSLVFDNADVRDILRLIAEISDLNIIASDAVEGNVTLRLIDVPWDQALDLILDVTGLGMVQDGNVVRVLPKDVIREKREAELTAARSQEKLEPLRTEVVTVSYADLKSVADPAKDLLSDRGNITADSRNKLLIITDVPQRIEKAKQLIAILDTPERQVMIEARIVQVNSNYSRELGVHWGLFTAQTGTDPSFQSITSAGGNFLVDITPGTIGPITPPMGLATQVQIANLIDDVVLDLQLQAMQTDGKGKVISTPRVTTLNGETATISQGTSIPYQTSGADGPKTEFVNAELKLEVTPVINPDNSIILEILATNDQPSLTAGASAPSIDTKKAETKVLIHDGETTVIGGIYVENEQSTDEGIPGLMNIPVLGHLFKTQKKQIVRDELLIFITPRIVNIN